MSKPRILLVEDDAVVRMDLEGCLRDLGFEVAASCTTGEDAIDTAAETRPDVVLMDIFLQGEMDGVDAARSIRSDCRVPVIYLSGYCDEIAVARAKLTEPSGYLLKPYDRETLRATITSALDRRKTSQERKLQAGILYNFGMTEGNKTLTR